MQSADKLSQLYQTMFQAKQSGDNETAESLMIQIEKLRTKRYTSLDSKIIEAEILHLPQFAQSVLGKSQHELGLGERSNCINAAFNYHDAISRWEIYSTMDFLNRIQNEFTQIEREEKSHRGDLIVLWSRTGGSWDNRSINVHEMDTASPEFPYGLVFDHVAVRLTDELVFHKADPTPQSRYQIEPLSAIMSVTAKQRGFEMTYHRKKSSVE